MMTPNRDKIENIRSFSDGEISFKCELKDTFGFNRRSTEWLKTNDLLFQ